MGNFLLYLNPIVEDERPGRGCFQAIKKDAAISYIL
jgi:hypothetical protein